MGYVEPGLWSRQVHKVLLMFDPGVHPFVVAGGGGGPAHGQGSARLAGRRKARPERVAGRVCGDPAGEEQP